MKGLSKSKRARDKIVQSQAVERAANTIEMVLLRSSGSILRYQKAGKLLPIDQTLSNERL